MTLKNILSLIEGELVTSQMPTDTISMVCSSDLMSDVLTQEPEEAVLITGLANIQAIRTAEMADIDHIVFVRDKEITKCMIELAEESGISLSLTAFSMFRVCGLLYEAGLKPAF